MRKLTGQRYLYVTELPGRVGHALHTVFVDDLDERAESIGARESSPPRRRPTETVCARVIYQDPDGNETGFGRA